MFCSQCGKSCLPNAKFCHNCGANVSCNNAAEVQQTSSKSSSPSTGNSSIGSSNLRPITFAEFCSCKEINRSLHFKGKNLKRLKSHGKCAKTNKVKISIGIMTKPEDAPVVKRGISLPIFVSTAVNYDNLLKKSVEKHHGFNKAAIQG